MFNVSAVFEFCNYVSFVGSSVEHPWSSTFNPGPSSFRIYKGDGKFYDPRLGTWFDLVPKSQPLLSSVARAEIATPRTEPGSDYSSYTSCPASLEEDGNDGQGGQL